MTRILFDHIARSYLDLLNAMLYFNKRYTYILAGHPTTHLMC